MVNNILKVARIWIFSQVLQSEEPTSDSHEMMTNTLTCKVPHLVIQAGHLLCIEEFHKT